MGGGEAGVHQSGKRVGIEARRTFKPGGQMASTTIQRRTAATPPFVSTLARDVDRLFSQAPGLFHFPFRFAPLASEANWLPAAEMTDTDAEYLITAEVPGLKKENLKVEYADGVLTVSGEKKEEQKKEDSRYYFCDRSYGMFQRSFTFPVDVDPDKVVASMKDGVLQIHVPKAAKAKVE